MAGFRFKLSAGRPVEGALCRSPDTGYRSGGGGSQPSRGGGTVPGSARRAVSRWRPLERRQGDVRPGPLGGDRPSRRVEAQAPRILGLLAGTPDITAEELRVTLGERGHAFGYGTLERFFVRHRITRKKDRARQRRRIPLPGT